ncbi:MAG: cold-shock protein [Bacteroidales bacterium]|nr:cold-shock protein [Bacteroidales bacterium]
MSKKIKITKVFGTVEWFDNTKGFGYITTDNGNKIFVYYADLPIKDGDFIVLRANQKVAFDIFKGPRGAQAKNIDVL